MSNFVWNDDGDAGVNTLRWCLDEVAAGGAGPHTIDFQLTPGSIVTLLSELPDITEDVSIINVTSYGDVLLDCGSMGAGVVLHIDDGVTFSCENLRLDGGTTSSDMYFIRANNSSAFTFTNCGFTNHANGGAVAALIICETENVNGVFEGGVMEDVANTTFDHFLFRADGVPLTKGRVEFNNIQAKRCGTSSSASADVTFDGGVWDGEREYANFRHMHATGVAGIDIKIHNTEVTGYCAQNGGAGRMDNAVNVDIFNSKIYSNEADTNFGGAYMFGTYSGTLTIRSSFMEDNQSVWTGGALHLDLNLPTVSPMITDTVFRNNRTTTQDGGAIHWGGSLVTDNVAVQYNVTYQDNVADRWGGAERNSLSGGGQRVKRYFNTYKGNRAGSNGGGAIYNNSGDSRSESCVYVDNLENTTRIDIRVTGGTINGSYNLMSGSHGSGIVDSATNKVDTGYNFDVDDMADNGGPWPSCRMQETCDGYLWGDQATVDALGIDFDCRGDPFVRVFVLTQPCAGAYEVQSAPVTQVPIQAIFS